MIIVSPDRFPPLSPAEAAAAIAPVVGGTAFPLIDAYLGTSSHFAGERITLPTTTVTGRLTEATYTFNQEITTAFIDMAAASGKVLGCDPVDGDSYGTGVLIADAVARRATTIVLSTGGSGAHDLGAGILTALGAQLQTATGRRLSPGAHALAELGSIDLNSLNTGVLGVTWIVYAPEVCGVDELHQPSVEKLTELTGVEPTATSGSGGGVPLALQYLVSLAGTGKVLVFNPLTMSEPYQQLRSSAADAELIITATPADKPTALTRAVRAASGDTDVIELTGAGEREWTAPALAEWVSNALLERSTGK